MSKAEALYIENIQDNIKFNLLNKHEKKIPHVIKYMGAKKKILSFVIDAINDTYEDGKLCDLFGGTSILSGALGKIIPIHSNDIQEYSSILAKTYLSDYDWDCYSDNILDEITNKAQKYVAFIQSKFPELAYTYDKTLTIEEFVALENKQQELINLDFNGVSYHLFTKYYSGTYWSYEQCLWIDAIRKVADDFKSTPIYNLILSSLMFAMSYNSQSTGHFAQYRDAKSLSSKEDIHIYRKKEILPYFKNKFNELREFLNNNNNNLHHRVTSLDYSDCLEEIEQNSLVYADPPYGFVHYSRFYHAFETLVKYDYPEVAYKGRYREERHQSPFCKRKEVKSAFKTLFEKINSKNAKLILSYSNTGMISLDEILSIAKESLACHYFLDVKEVAYKHSTMGRKNDKNRDVQEFLIIANHL